jgi:hypothetical protein
MKTKWLWISIEKGDGFLGRFCQFLTDNNLEIGDFIEMKEQESEKFRFYVHKQKDV